MINSEQEVHSFDIFSSDHNKPANDVDKAPPCIDRQSCSAVLALKRRGMTGSGSPGIQGAAQLLRTLTRVLRGFLPRVRLSRIFSLI